MNMIYVEAVRKV